MLTRKKTASSFILAVVRDVIVSNAAVLGLMSVVLKIPNIFVFSKHSGSYPFKYFAFVVAIGLVFLFGREIAEGVIFFEHAKPKHKVGTWILRIFSALFAALSAAAVTASIWAAETFAGLTPDQMLITLNGNTGGTSDEVMITMFQGPILTTAVVTILFCVFAFSTRKIKYKLPEKQFTVFQDLQDVLYRFSFQFLCLQAELCSALKSFHLKSSTRHIWTNLRILRKILPIPTK